MMARRHEYNARMSLARSVLDYAIGVQAPTVPLNAQQQAQMTNEGLTPLTTGSWLQALALDANRRFSDVNWAAQLQSMPPASVEREIAHELAATTICLPSSIGWRFSMRAPTQPISRQPPKPHFRRPFKWPRPISPTDCPNISRT